MGRLSADNFESVPEFPMDEAQKDEVQQQIEGMLRTGHNLGNDGVIGPKIVNKVEVEFDYSAPLKELPKTDTAVQLYKDAGRIIAEAAGLSFRAARLVRGLIRG
jgi:hypothetical protein